MKGRPALNALRAFSVLAIVICNFDLGLTGGYVGIDVLFLLSGYLTFAVRLSPSDERFDLKAFLRNCIARIWPMAGVTCVLCSVASTSVFDPDTYQQVVRAALPASLFLSNFYFSGTSLQNLNVLNPFFHFVALSLLVQFQLASAFAFANIKILRRKKLMALITLCIASLFAALVLKPDAEYFIPERLWEFCAGGALEWASGFQLRRFRFCYILGLVSLGLSFAVLPPSAGPLLRLAPLVACTTVIFSAGSWPSPRVLTYLSRLSYPVYLIQWPAWVFLRSLHPTAITMASKLLLLVAVILLAIFFHHAIEQPVRKSFSGLPFRAALTIGLGILTFSGLISFLAASTMTIPNRSADDEHLGSYRDLYEGGRCSLDLNQQVTDYQMDQCLNGSSHVDILLWGDRVSAQLLLGLRESLQGKIISQASAAGCLPFEFAKETLDENSHGTSRCFEFNRFVIDKVLPKARPTLIILAAKWSRERDPLNEENFARAFARGIGRLKSLGLSQGFRIAIAGETPLFDEAEVKTSTTDNWIQAKGYPNLNRFLEQEAARADLVFLNPTALFCGSRGCLHDQQGKALFWDQDKLTEHGSRRWAKNFAPRILDAMTKVQER